MKLNTPILLITYNKPKALKEVLNQIKKVKPTELYIASDNSKHQNDAALVKEVRKIITDLDIPGCNIHTKFNSENLGCRNGVVGAINWFFSDVEAGIILEEDCKPNTSFFFFCSELLEKYKNDSRIFQISGSNPFYSDETIESDYFFSKYIRIWGWATWKKNWQKYDKDIPFWPQIKKSRIHESFFNTKKEAKYWEKIWDDCYSGKIDTWDYQLLLIKLLENSLTVIPNTNLVSNIGFTKQATHTKFDLHKIGNYPTRKISLPLKHPIFFNCNNNHDSYYRNIFLTPLAIHVITYFATSLYEKIIHNA